MASTHKDIIKTLGSKSPWVVLKKWLKQAQKSPKVKEPWAMCLSTVDSQNKSSSRIVLLKKIDKDKIIFFTNYQSPKGKDLNKNSSASVVFFWPQLERQIRIAGKVKKTSRKESVAYWKTRPKQSQISQWISKQSQEVADKKTLEQLQKQALEKFKNKPCPCPTHWGGYSLTIHKIEFWKGHAYRLHDRFLFTKTNLGWKVKRLFP